jgi:DNA (cytosine-5)-methyltransferase 3A
MNVLSLFDGMSCGQLALERANVSVDNYYACEIDKYAIQIAQKNFPNTIQLGDVRDVITSSSKSKYAPTFYEGEIDLLMGGSPCQGFSFAGEQLAFDDPRSKLFFEFIRIMNDLKPRYVLLENVRMKKQFEDVITEHMGFPPQLLNSSKVSAQNRWRNYWFGTYINGKYEQIMIPPLEDKGLVLKDILQTDHDEPPVPINERNAKHHKNPNQKALCTTATMYKGAGNNGMTLVDRLMPVGEAEEYAHYNYRATKEVYHMDGKAPTLLTMQGGNREPKVATYSPKGGRIVNRRLDANGVRKDYQMDLPLEPQVEVRSDDKTNCLTTVQKDNVVVQGMTWRKLTPVECERLQTLPDNYTEGVSKTQRYKMIGNGWTVDVIAHILGEMLLPKKIKSINYEKGYFVYA